MTYFGLGFDVYNEMETNWNTWYDEEEIEALATTGFIPTGNKNSTNYAYW